MGYKFLSVKVLVFLMMQSRSLKYTLLNHQDIPVPGCYIEIHSFPEEDSLGEAMYYDFRGTADPINFNRNIETHTYDAWYIRSPTNCFSMTLVIDGEIGQLDVRFSHLSDFVAHFVLNADGDSSPMSDDIIEANVSFMELD